MNSIINVESIDEILVLKTQGYLNKDLGEEILEVAKENIEGNGQNRNKFRAI